LKSALEKLRCTDNCPKTLIGTGNVGNDFIDHRCALCFSELAQSKLVRAAFRRIA
jgi:hypothetical protein